LNNAPLVHHRNPVGNIKGFFTIMGDQDRRRVFLAQHPGDISRK
jgi:hypothetical protein